MRYHVKNAEGRELECPSLSDLHALYTHGFIEEDDLVRAAGSQRWVRAGDMPALRGVRERRRDPVKVALILAAALVLGLALMLLVKLRG